MPSNQPKFFRQAISLLDIIALNFCFSVIMTALPSVHHSLPYMILSGAINIGWIISSYSYKLYFGKTGIINNFFILTFKTYLLFLGITLSFIFLYHYGYSRLFILLVLSSFLVILIFSRSIFVGVGFVKDKNAIKKNIVLIGCNDLSKRLIKYFNDYKNSIKIHGCFDNDDNLKTFEGLPTLGVIDTVLSFALRNNINEIYSTVSPETHPQIYQLAEEAEKHFIKFKFVPDLRIFIKRNMYVELVKDIPVLSMRPDPLEDRDTRFKKRLFDIVFTIFITLTILWWLIPLVVLLIKLESKGPVFFKQKRSGKNNTSFNCYKFRSLKVNGECDTVQVLKDDKRFTRIGKFLRKTNIDELPQIFNVWQNTMSVVGPRPHMLHHTKEWSEISKQYMLRHYLKPGITGWAQVNGYRGEINNGEALIKRVEHDLWYMENWSMYLDMRIILLSIVKTLWGDKNAV